MEIVDVLGDDGGNLAGAIEARQRPVSPPRPGVAELVGHGEAAPPGFVARLLAGQELVVRDRLVLGPKAPRRTEIRDAAFGRNAGPRKWDNDPSLVDQVLEVGLGGIEIGCDHPSDPWRIDILTDPNLPEPTEVRRRGICTQCCACTIS